MHTTFDKRLNISEVLEDVKKICSIFLYEHKKSLCSIVLTGSLARREFSSKSKSLDADISLVTWKYYNPLLCRRLKRYLQRSIKGIEFDVGRSWPVSRAKVERSLFLYDIKYNGVILAGKDVRSIIPSISAEDLYPCECIRLLLNACCHLVFSLCNEEESIRRGIDKALAWCLDAYLLLQGEFANTYRARRQITERKYPVFYKQIVEVESCRNLNIKYKLARAEILKTLNLIKANLKLKRIGDIVGYVQSTYIYSLSFRFYSLLTSRLPKSILVNPIFDVYVLVVDVLKKTRSLDGLNVRNACNNKRFQHFKHIWERLPQPVVRRSTKK